jgi:hypothetical protein
MARCPDCGAPEKLCGCHEVVEGAVGDLTSLIRNGDWLDDQEFADLTFVVEQLIPEGFTILAGAPKAGKSWLALAISLAAAEAGTVMGCIEVAQRDVLYLALEDGDRRLQKRARSLLDGRRIPGRWNRVLKVPKADALGLISTWLESLDDPTNALVVVDTAQKIRPPARQGASLYEADYEFGSSIKDLADAHQGLAIVAVHHTRKMKAEDFVEMASGSFGLTGSADTVIILERKRGESSGRISLVSRDLDSDGIYKVERRGNGWDLVGGSLGAARQAAAEEVETENLGETSREVLAFVEEHPRSSPSQIKRALDHVAPDAVESAIRRLHDSGRLVRTDRGRYAYPALVDGPGRDVDQGTVINLSEIDRRLKEKK